MVTSKWKKHLFFMCKLLVGIIVFSPILYALLVSFMTPSQVSSYPPKVIPDSLNIVNYRAVLERFPLFTYLGNSLITCAIIIMSQVVMSSLAAYAFTFFSFPGKNILFAAVLTTMMIPGETIIIANYLTICNMNLINSYAALVLPYLVSGMGIFLLRQFYLTLPGELREAASIDGCGDWRFLWYIAAPVSLPSICALSVYVFVVTYNQYMWPLFVTNSSNMRTVQVGMSMLMDAETTNYGNVTAGAIMVLIPVIFIYVIGQQYLVKGMTSGAVKG